MTAARPASAALRAAWAVGALLLVALVVGAASIGPSSVLGGDGRGGSSTTIAEPTDGAGGADAGTLGRLLSTPPPDRPAGWPRGVGLAFEALAVLGIGWLGWRILARLLTRRSARPEPVAQAEPEVPEPTDPPLPSAPTRRSASATDVAVASGGAPRNDVVACWHELELDAVRAGIVPRRWQTPSEFVLAMLDRSTVDPAAVSDLAELYRRARFSDHPTTPADLARAREALATARGTLVVRSRRDSG